jgi:hypothetical protein
MCAKIEESISVAALTLRAGQCVIVNRSTPLSFEGVPAKESPDAVEEHEATFVVKTVVLELLRKTTRRKILYAQTLANGGTFTSGLFNEDFPLSYLQKNTAEEPVVKKLFTLADPARVPFFVPPTPKPSKPVEGVVKKMKSEEEESPPSSVSSSSSAAAAAAEPKVRPALLEQSAVQ